MTTADQDITLWESFRNGDRDAFASLFREHYATLYRFGSKFTPDSLLIEDCIQELFIELWQTKSRTPVISVKAYLLKSLKYKLFRSFTQKGRLVEWQDNGQSHFEWSHETFLIAEQEDKEKKRRVLEAMGQLSGRQKEIIYLKYYQGLSYDEVSEIMNINYQVARNLLHQAIKSLKKFLASSLDLIFVFF